VGWPLQTFEIEVHGDSKSTNERGSSLVGVRWAFHAGIRDICSALAALVGPVKYIFSSQYTTLIHLSSKLGRQRYGVACLSVCVSGKTFVAASKREIHILLQGEGKRIDMTA
jgi:hypothetical protein